VKYTYLFLLLSLLLGACTTPKKAYESGNHSKAISLIIKKLKKNEATKADLNILSKASNELVKTTLAKNDKKSRSPKVKNWIKVSEEYYEVLENVGEANQKSKGHITSSYDKICSAKKEVDFKIIDYFYEEGIVLLDKAANTGLKKAARQAHVEFENCVKYGGKNEYNDLEDMLEESHERGIVYFTSWDIRPNTTFWVKPLPRDADYEADCDVTVDKGFVNFMPSSSSTTKTYYEDVQTGSNTETDTAGIVTTTPIYTEVSAQVTITTRTLTASSTTNIYVRDLSGHCTLRGESFTIDEVDEYEEVTITGDLRAVPSGVSAKSGEPTFFRSGLEDDVQDEVNRRIDGW